MIAPCAMPPANSGSPGIRLRADDRSRRRWPARRAPRPMPGRRVWPRRPHLASTNAVLTPRAECDGGHAPIPVFVTTRGLIGSARIGSAVARLAVDAGHDVVLSNSRGPQTLADLVAELGPRARAGSRAGGAAGGGPRARA